MTDIATTLAIENPAKLRETLKPDGAALVVEPMVNNLLRARVDDSVFDSYQTYLDQKKIVSQKKLATLEEIKDYGLPDGAYAKATYDQEEIMVRHFPLENAVTAIYFITKKKIPCRYDNVQQRLIEAHSLKDVAIVLKEGTVFGIRDFSRDINLAFDLVSRVGHSAYEYDPELNTATFSVPTSWKSIRAMIEESCHALQHQIDKEYDALWRNAQDLRKKVAGGAISRGEISIKEDEIRRRELALLYVKGEVFAHSGVLGLHKILTGIGVKIFGSLAYKDLLKFESAKMSELVRDPMIASHKIKILLQDQEAGFSAEYDASKYGATGSPKG